MSSTSLDSPFTLILTVPKHLVGAEGDATEAVDPLLTVRFGWTHYDVLDPKQHDDVYRRALKLVRDQAGECELVDAEQALLRVQRRNGSGGLEEGQDLFVRVVRLFPESFPLGPCSPVVGLA